MLSYWIHSLDPFIIKFPGHWGIQGIKWYGCAYLLGFLIGYWMFCRWAHSGKIRLTREQIQNYLFASFCGILIGGRLGYVCLYHLDYYIHNPLAIVRIWDGGMAFHGACLGLFISWCIWGAQQKLSALSLSDLCIVPGTLGIFLGRCANFINGEVYGRITQMPWGVIFPMDCFARHPSQLYEALGEGLVLFIWSLKRTQDERMHRYPGLLASHFVIGYSLIRYILEYFREPDAPLIGCFTRGQMYSIVCLLIGLVAAYRLKKHPIPCERSVFTKQA